MKIRRAIIGAIAGVSVLMGGGTIAANAATPMIGSTGCSSPWYVHQYTSYHGTICYTNTGHDDLHTSGFWTTSIYSGANMGSFRACSTQGACRTYAMDSFTTYYFNYWTSGVGSLIALDIDEDNLVCVGCSNHSVSVQTP